MLEFGTVVQLPNAAQVGLIKDSNGKTQVWATTRHATTLTVGARCAFELHCRRIRPSSVRAAFLTKDRRWVVDRRDSHLHNGIGEELLAEALQRCDTLGERELKMTLDMGRSLGQCNCIATTASDDIVYAKRLGRYGHSRFVKGRVPTPTSHITLVLRKTHHYYKIVTGYLGTSSMPEPYDARADRAALLFWAHHALIWGTEPVDNATITTVSPWPSLDEVPDQWQPNAAHG